ncbi:hypothetical protein Pint_32094 [Pistacia integerrima]|uniref:Uncharacterized protein n=1 Tax=Pistacia integerrima TaxID=434235 RepID=A0ACC0XS13_9ROSI|nr:hypothetical protein Pint_32094 [Pistacia integerrima]
MVSSALPETAASVAIAATVVGAAAIPSWQKDKECPGVLSKIPMKTCEDCGGSGICSECNGEGFVLKKLSDKSAERARMTAKNAATRYTAGLPQEMELLYKMFFFKILYYLRWPWEVKLLVFLIFVISMEIGASVSIFVVIYRRL